MKFTALLLATALSVAVFAFSGAPAQVSISLGGNGVVVSPDRVEVGPGGQVRWLSSGDQRATVEIVFSQGSPFPEAGNAENPSRGRYRKNVGSPILTRGADSRGQFKYAVVWTTADGAQYVLDPMVVVR